MVERDENGWDIDLRRTARQELAKGAADYADAHENTAGALCTGYVMVMEFTTAEGRYCQWLTGNGGSPDADNTEGLDSWRVDGLVRKVLRDIDAQNVSRD